MKDTAPRGQLAQRELHNMISLQCQRWMPSKSAGILGAGRTRDHSGLWLELQSSSSRVPAASQQSGAGMSRQGPPHIHIGCMVDRLILVGHSSPPAMDSS